MRTRVSSAGGDAVDGWLYSGAVFHRRRRPRVHALRYRVFSLLLDIDRIDDLADRIPWFSRNKFNLISFYDDDFTVDKADEAIDLRAWVEVSLKDAGLDSSPNSIWLSCYPRVFGYAFNPLSLYYCRNAAGETYAIIHEVHNTFGERHAYVLPVTERRTYNKSAWIEQTASKRLFVSPFADTSLTYDFRLNEPAESQVVVIRASDASGVLITASYTASRSRLTSRVLLLQVMKMPWMTFKVTVGIHYEALKLWLKRTPLFSHVPKARLLLEAPAWKNQKN